MDHTDDSESIEIPVNDGDDLLIDLVGARPWLYDKASKGYSDQIMTRNGWHDISGIMNDTSELFLINYCDTVSAINNIH